MIKYSYLIDKKTLDWFLEKNNPSVQYSTLINLPGRTSSEIEASETRKDILTTGIVPELLGKMEAREQL